MVVIFLINFNEPIIFLSFSKISRVTLEVLLIQIVFNKLVFVIIYYMNWQLEFCLILGSRAVVLPHLYKVILSSPTSSTILYLYKLFVFMCINAFWH